MVDRIRGRKLQAIRLAAWTLTPCCARCGRLTEWPDGFALDHVVALVNGGKDEQGNRQVLCLPCHDLKTNEDLQRAPDRPTFDAQGRVEW